MSKEEGMISKGLSIDQPLFEKAMEVARREERSFSFIVRRAIQRDLDNNRVRPTLAPVTDLDHRQKKKKGCSKAAKFAPLKKAS